MAKTDSTSTTTNRRMSSVAPNVTGKPFTAAGVIAVDIAQDGVNFVRSSTQTDLDTAETVALALALSAQRPTRVTIDGAPYQIYSRNGG